MTPQTVLRLKELIPVYGTETNNITYLGFAPHFGGSITG